MVCRLLDRDFIADYGYLDLVEQEKEKAIQEKAKADPSSPNGINVFLTVVFADFMVESTAKVVLLLQKLDLL